MDNMPSTEPNIGDADSVNLSDMSDSSGCGLQRYAISMTRSVILVDALD